MKNKHKKWKVKGRKRKRLGNRMSEKRKKMTTRTPMKPAGGAGNSSGKNKMPKKDKNVKDKRITEFYGDDKKDKDEKKEDETKSDGEERKDEDVGETGWDDVKQEVRKLIKDMKKAFEEDKKKRKALHSKELE